LSITSRSAAPLRVGVLGLGTVGASVLRILASRSAAIQAEFGRPIQVVAAAVRSRGRHRGAPLDGVALHDDPVALARDAPIDVLVELMGGADGPAKAAVEAAIARGLPVVTANKALLAAHGTALFAAAEARGVPLLFEASVAGGIPIVKTMREALPGNEIRSVRGILNGTCNYMLTRMEMEGLDYAACLAEAQRLGYAEADPTFDVGGYDSAHKLAILAGLAFGARIDAAAVSVEGIDAIAPLDLAMAREFGFRIKLLGVAERREGGLAQRVSPTMLPLGAPLAGVMGVTNAVTIETDRLGALTLIGPGAGGEATASAVVADIAEIARGAATPSFRLPVSSLQASKASPEARHEGGFYVRMTALDRRGAFAAIAGRMAEQGISIESIIQKGAPKSRTVPVILITHATDAARVRRALDGVVADGVLEGRALVIRIDR
jgi:homoserine dehydrogenase